MRRVQDIVWPVVGLGAVAVSAWLLVKELRHLSLASLGAAFSAISPAQWALACASTTLAYAALAWYDRIALMHLGRRIGWPFVALTSFVTYAIAHTIGASVLSGAVIRYRAYSTKGLGVGEVGLLVAFCSFTFGLGAVTLGGLVLLIQPDIAARFEGAPEWVGRAAGAVLIAAPALYLVASLLHLPTVRIAGYELTWPRPPIALRQLLAGPLELIGAAGLIWFVLPPGAPGYLVTLGVFLASFCLALASHAPGGLGVLEIAFLAGMPDVPQANVVAALLVFRLLYLMIPLVFSLAVVLVFERGRWRAFVPPAAEPAHALDDRPRR